MRLTVSGATRLESTAHRAADQARNVAAEWGEAAGAIVVAAVDPPIRTGRLASTVHVVVTPEGFGIAAGGDQAPYAAIVNARHPFITPAFEARESAALDTAEQVVEHLVGTITGA